KAIGVGYEVRDILAKPVSPDEILKALKRCGVEPSNRRPILVVDDDESALKLADKTLRELGYRAVCRQDVTSALSAAAKERPAAVILDLVIPEINGFEFLKRFRNTRAGRRTPVVVWTGKDLTSAERRQLQSTADSVVMKSEGADELLRELKEFYPRLILMDVQLPGIDGLELTRRLKSDPATQDITILGLTAYAMKGDKERIIAAGCDGYIPKPIDTRTLPELVAGYLQPME